ncbi:hypothetical protein GGR51DRAFT_567780 [Nemania sp. FL0031]|nr:hypothetical protein GGR51DRAFT_567780 [Nemania sp. FL0031]
MAKPPAYVTDYPPPYTSSCKQLPTAIGTAFGSMRSCQQPNYRVSATLPLCQLPCRARHSRKRAADAEIRAAVSWQDIGQSALTTPPGDLEEA